MSTIDIARRIPQLEVVRNRSLARASHLAQLTKAATFLAGGRRCACPASFRRCELAVGTNTFTMTVQSGPLDGRALVLVTLESSWESEHTITVAAVTSYDAVGESVDFAPGVGSNLLELGVAIGDGTAPTAPGRETITLTITVPSSPPDGVCALASFVPIQLPFDGAWNPGTVDTGA